MQNNSPAIFDIKDYTLFLTDESRLSGNAVSISFPESRDELVAIARYCDTRAIPVTVQGSRTGISGGAVPESGHVISMSRMKKILGFAADPAGDRYIIKVEPGLTLSELRERLYRKAFDTSGWSVESLGALARFASDGEFFFPPDPTEPSASLGGMVSCNASGARSFGYGATRMFVEALGIVLADGRSAVVRRKQNVTAKRSFVLVLDDGSIIEGEVPPYPGIRVKNAAGYFANDDMDLVDLFVGAEGTLAIVSSIELALVRKPKTMCGVTVFLGSDDEAIRFAGFARGDMGSGLLLPPVAIEFFNRDALHFLTRMKEENEAFSFLPLIPPNAGAAVYAEFHAESSDRIDDALTDLLQIIEKCGGREEDTWIATEPKEFETLTAFRHALPEAVNMYVAGKKKEIPAITKLGTDMSVPDDRLAEIYDLYRSGLQKEKLDSVIFGHIGNNHLHVNILPKTIEEFERGKAMYLDWARRVVSLGGSVSAEHGIGKLKKKLLEEMYGESGIAGMRRCKELFDPKHLLGRGNLFDA